MQVMKLRLRDKHRKDLNRQARAVNYVWNYCNQTQQKAVNAKRKWLHKYDLQKLTAGSSKILGIHAHTIQQVCWGYDRSRRTHNKAWLKWRGQKSPGWVPFNQGNVKKVGGGLYRFNGCVFETMHDRYIPEGAVIRSGSFNEDARGNWYLNVPIDVPAQSIVDPLRAVGIDLGLKDDGLATLSDGTSVSNPKHFKRLEEKLGKAQRARKKKQARNIHAKIKHSRKDHLHKASAAIAKARGNQATKD